MLTRLHIDLVSCRCPSIWSPCVMPFSLYLVLLYRAVWAVFPLFGRFSLYLIPLCRPFGPFFLYLVPLCIAVCAVLPLFGPLVSCRFCSSSSIWSPCVMPFGRFFLYLVPLCRAVWAVLPLFGPLYELD